MRVRSQKDLAGGLAMAVIAVLFMAGSFGLRLGTAQRMGPAYFPLMISVLLLILAVLIMLRSVQVDSDFPTIAWRPLVWVTASLVGFAAGFTWLGFIPAIVLTVALAALADRASRPVGTLLLGIGFAVGAWLIFRVGLSLPMPAFRGLPWSL